MLRKKIIKIFKFSAIFFFVVIFLFSNVVSFLPQVWQNNKLIENLEIKQALAAAPTFVAAGPFTGGIGSLPVSLPSGIVADDILLLFIETANQVISITDQGGGIWGEAANSPQSTGTTGDVAATRLTVFWSRYNGTQGGPTINDSGDHQIARIIAVRGTISSGNPIDVAAGGVEAVVDTSGVIPGAITTVDEAFVVTAIATALPDANSSTVFSGWANANLTSVAEQTDDAKNSGNGGGLGIATGVKTTAGDYGNTTVAVSTATAKAMLSIALKPAAAPLTTLTVNVSGNQTANLDSGISNTWLGGAFTFSINTGATNVTNIMVSNNGTAGNLSDIRLFYDANNNGYDAGDSCFNAFCGDGQGGALGTGISGTISLLSGNTYYIYVIADVASSIAGGLAVDLQITNPSTDIATGASNTDTNTKNITGSTAIRPNVTDVTDSPLGDGGRNGETFTIAGAGFGVSCVSVSVQVEGTALTCNSANNTTISATVPSGQTTTYGGTGANGLLVTVGGTADDTRQTYYVYPSVNLVSSLVSNADREGNDIIFTNSTANNARFGATQGAVDFVGGFGAVAANVVSWGDTSVTVTVPAGISDSVYTGDIKITRNSDSKTDNTYDSDGFRILPKIQSFNPTQQVEGSAVEIIGDHLCQSGTCPGILSAANKVTFTSSIDATTLNSWNHGDSSSQGINVNVPTGAVTGNVFVTSDTSYTSNNLSFTVQKKPNIPTRDEPINGANTGTLTPVLKTTTTDPNNDDLQYKIEIATNNIFTTGLQTFDQSASQTGWSGQNSGGGTRYTSNTQSVYTVQTPLSCSTTFYWRTYAKDPLGANTWSNTQGADQSFTSAPCNVAPTLSISQPDGVGDSINVGDLYNVTYSLADTDNIVTAAFYYDTNNTGLDGVAITGACATAVEGSGITCSWNTTNMPVGSYYVYGITNDGVNPQVSAYSPGIITINIVAPTVTATSAGTQTTNINSGATAQYIGGAFRFQQNGGSADTITALTISEISASFNANANSSNATIRYAANNSGACAYAGTETIAKTGTTFDASDKATFTALASNIPLTLNPNYTCVYLIFNVSANASGGQQIEIEINSINDFTLSGGTTKTGTYPVAISGSTTLRPNITSITSYPDASQLGGKIGQTIQIAGAGFGTACSVAGGNKISVGTYDLSCAGATFNNTTISIPIDTSINVYGGSGANGLLATIGNTADDVRQEYHILPSINQIITPSITNAARESENITLTNSTANAAKFGTTQGTATLTGGFGSVSASIVSWSDTVIELAVPTAISDSVYLGDITIQRAVDANSKTTTAYGSNGFRILPKINLLNPDTASVTDSIIIVGNHLCQTGSCPLAGSRSASSDNVTFNNGALQVSDGNVTAWGHGDSATSGITVIVPSGVTNGNVIAKSNDYNSNGVNFTLISTTPHTPSNLYQFKTNTDLNEPPATHNPLTNENPAGAISAGGGINQTNVWLRATASADVNDTLCIQVEVKTVATAFDGIGLVDGTNPDGCKSFSVGNPEKLFVQVAGLTNGNSYKWRTRIKNNRTGEYGDWTIATVDAQNKSFYIDTTAPTFLSTVCPPSAYTASTADISWTPNDNVSSTYTKQAQYGTDPTFTASNCSPGSTCGTPTSGLNSGTQLVQLTGLAPSTVYYYRVRSKDAAGNEATDGYGINGNTTCTFTTSLAQMRTVEYIITGETGSVSAEISRLFQIYITEQGSNIQNAFIELTGIAGTGGGNSLTLGIKVEGSNTVSYTNYDVAVSNTVATPFTILHKINPTTSGIYIGPAQTDNNSLFINPSVGPSIYIASAKIIVTYYYTPQ